MYINDQHLCNCFNALLPTGRSYATTLDQMDNSLHSTPKNLVANLIVSPS